MNTFNVALVLLSLCACLTALVCADEGIHIGYWYEDRSCNPRKAKGMYVKNIGDSYPVDAGAVYLVRPGNLMASEKGCGGHADPTKVYACEAFQPPKRVTCVQNIG